MSNPALQEILLGGFAYFVESGLTVDGATVGPTIKPDMVPATNWTNGSLGTILSFEFGGEKIDAPYMAPQASGGYAKVNRSFASQDYLILQSREMNELAWRLQSGFTTIITEGTAQTPGLSLDRKIFGWLRLQGRNLNANDRFLMDWWCEARLESKQKFDDKVVSPSLRFTLIPSVAGTAVAGNSTNFPVGG